jgi:hypothetical protein
MSRLKEEDLLFLKACFKANMLAALEATEEDLNDYSGCFNKDKEALDKLQAENDSLRKQLAQVEQIHKDFCSRVYDKYGIRI